MIIDNFLNSKFEIGIEVQAFYYQLINYPLAATVSLCFLFHLLWQWLLYNLHAPILL